MRALAVLLALLAGTVMAQPWPYGQYVNDGRITIHKGANFAGVTDAGALIITCPDGTCSGGGGSPGGAMQLWAFIDGGAVTLDGGPALALGRATTAAPTYTNGTDDPLSLDLGGLLRVSVGNSPAVTVSSGTVTANQGGAPWSQNVTQFGGSNVVTGTGTSGAGIPRVTVSNDSTVTCNEGGTPWTVAGSGTFTVGGTVTANQGGSPWGQNLTQVNSATVNVGIGTASTGTQRVAVASDSSITCNAGSNLNTSALATSANQTTLGSQTTKINDGTTTANVIAATNALKVDLASVAGTATATAAGGIAVVSITGAGGASLDTSNGGTLPTDEVAIGFESASQTVTQPTAVSAGKLRRAVASLDGIAYVREYGPVNWRCGVDAIGASLTQCQAAPSAGLSLYVTDIIIQSTTTTAGLFALRYGTGSNCATSTGNLLPASVATARYAYPAKTAAGAQVMSFKTPIIVPAANALCIICTATDTCAATILGYTSASGT